MTFYAIIMNDIIWHSPNGRKQRGSRLYASLSVAVERLYE